MTKETLYPAYLTKIHIDRTPNLKLALTAGVGSDHFDVKACVTKNITVAEVTGSNLLSVAKHAGDTWYPQPAPADHPWRTIRKNAMTVHYSGMTLEAQQCIEVGTKAILVNFFEEKPQKQVDLIVEGGEIVSLSYKIM